jgi:hypothetical protein
MIKAYNEKKLQKLRTLLIFSIHIHYKKIWYYGNRNAMYLRRPFISCNLSNRCFFQQRTALMYLYFYGSLNGFDLCSVNVQSDFFDIKNVRSIFGIKQSGVRYIFSLICLYFLIFALAEFYQKPKKILKNIF